MSQRVIYLEGHVRQTLPVLAEVPDDFDDEEDKLALSASIMKDLGTDIHFDYWQPFNTKVVMGEQGKPSIKVTRLKEEEFEGHIKFKVEKVK